MGTLTCTDRGKKGKSFEKEEPRRELRIKKQENTPDYELVRCGKILRNESEDTTKDQHQRNS